MSYSGTGFPADVTDVNGETHTGTTTVSAGDSNQCFRAVLISKHYALDGRIIMPVITKIFTEIYTNDVHVILRKKPAAPFKRNRFGGM
ncbi:MAG: hypothetical protein MZV63_15270 [Marinilabiliales bacterium]|nr:hypothetical protein [Marinilabiliales bacterium]